MRGVPYVRGQGYCCDARGGGLEACMSGLVACAACGGCTRRCNTVRGSSPGTHSAMGTAEPARLLPRGEAREPSIGGSRSCSLGLTFVAPVGGRLAPVGSCSRWQPTAADHWRGVGGMRCCTSRLAFPFSCTLSRTVLTLNSTISGRVSSMSRTPVTFLQ